ncbi:SDR family oxidoreductase [Sodalis ligni]|uniref:NADP-dependent 3-hydroxy acid dehydrogenase YdfG n=1 Tax=Sodalis ligni TaxID=2697027 RepID=A0A4R1NEJ3_9GAMM|nr:SDR family oxidoreductase [Sodalis ligni]TCL05327.1 NADP-dependent 3-hydroxy acid dehydrogenase YdfG [Sodalis ligni]
MSTLSWFITGTSSGFGRTLTEQLLARGDRVFATLRKTAALDDLKSCYENTLAVAQLDVTDTAAIRRVVKEAFERFGKIDVVINNAGFGVAGAAEEATDEQIRRQIDTNVIGSVQVTRAALPYLRAQGGGRILQLSSMGGQLSFPGLSFYHLSKWAIEGFYEAVIPEIAPFNIQVTLIEPGVAPTGFGGENLSRTPVMAVYEPTPVGDFRRSVAAGAFSTTGDAGKMVAAMIDSVSINPAPKRLALGSDAFDMIGAALVGRLADLYNQKAVALSTDRVPRTDPF